MNETQYYQFRDLDRRCVSRKFDPEACEEAVRCKRALIEFHRNNPLVREVLEGKTTFVSAYIEGSRAFRGFRRFLPYRADVDWNQRIGDLGRIIPNVEHFRRRGLFSIDNPISCGTYGFVLSLGAGILLGHAQRDERGSSSVGTLLSGDDFPLSFSLLLIVFGVLFGLFTMLRYRTRNPRQIHAREAALYMDQNYAFFRKNDDAGWACFIRSGSEHGDKSMG